MILDRGTSEVEAIITTKLLADKTYDIKNKYTRTEFSYSELLRLTGQVINSLFFTDNCRELRAIERRGRLFVIYVPASRILFEAGVSGEDSHGLIKRPKVLLFGKRGQLLHNKTMRQMIEKINNSPRIKR